MQILEKTTIKDNFNISKFLKSIIINKKKFYKILLISFPIVLFFVSFTMGKYHIELKDLLYIFYSKLFGLKQTWSKTIDLLIFNVRMPRIIAAMFVGSVLALSGTTFQGIFKNPLVAPDILGASAGAGFGAVIGIFLGFNVIGIELTAFIFGMVAVGLTYGISKIMGNGTSITLILILAGMVIAEFFSALVSLIQYLADPANMLQQSIAFWIMGGLSTINMKDVLIAFIPMLIGSTIILLLRWKLNVLSFGDEEAQTMGINTTVLRFILIVCTALITSASVALGGIISWVGLIIPNIARIVFGSNFKLLVPVSILIGGSFLLLVDDLARTIFPVDLPIGILTALIGGPLFAIVLLNQRDKLG